MKLALAIVITAACTPRVPPNDPSWVEREAGRRFDAHATATTTTATHDAPIDLAHPETLDEAAAEAALAQLGDRAPAATVALRAARLAHHRGAEAEARARLARAATAADEPRVHAELGELARELAEPPLEPRAIAVLLPITGPYAALGAELRRAIELAPAGDTHWLVLDTRGDETIAVAMVEEARAKGAIAILGPIGERESRAAARAAERRAIPIALLAPGDGADPAGGVFRLASSPTDEARAIARLAQTDGFPTVAVFAPRDDVARAQAAAFVAEATRLGLQVTGDASYDPTSTALEGEVKQFLNLVPASNPRLREHLARHGAKGWATFSPDIPFSFLYVPDRYDRAAIVAAFLAYENVELRTIDFPDPDMLRRKHGGHIPQIVQLAGGAGWHDPTLPIRGGAAVQGALVVDAFAAEAVDEVGAAFVTAMQRGTTRAPSSLAAQAYDAATLVAAARARAATRTGDLRGAMRAALASARLDAGACGAASMGPDGELAREPIVLEVTSDQLVPRP